MQKYRIAYFTADCNYELVESTLRGLSRYVEDHPQVSLCAFDCFGISRDPDRIISGFSIFDLPDLDDFHGLLVQGNQILPVQVREHISRMVLDHRIPAVSVDCPIEGCSLIGLDNRRAQMEITEHLIRVHRARKLVYLTGNLNNPSPNAPLRLEGFYDACERNGIPRDHTTVIPCFWQTDDGRRVGKAWLEAKRELPDAFVCANDEMAIGITEALASAGISVPEDVLVTGFDHIGSADLSDPSLTTVDRGFGNLNYRAMELLVGMIEGREVPEATWFDYSLVLSESCGCSRHHDLGLAKKQYFQKLRFLQSFNSLQDELSEELVRASSLPDLMHVFRQKSGLFGCGRVFLCVDSRCFEPEEPAGQDRTGDTGEMVMLQPAEGTSAAGEPSFVRFSRRSLLPEGILDENRFVIFYPLQSDSGSIGYLAMNGISEVTRFNLHQSLLSFLEIAIENVRKKQLLQRMNARLDHLYVLDRLTGLYNRFGLERDGEKLFNELLLTGKGAQLLFADMDGLKRINDEFGHEYGDRAILAAARILEAALGVDSFLMRYGGDEFLVIAPLDDRKLPERIRSGLRQYGSLPFPLDLSIGVRQVKEAENKTLYEWIRNADKTMYEEKRKKKQRQ